MSGAWKLLNCARRLWKSSSLQAPEPLMSPTWIENASGSWFMRSIIPGNAASSPGVYGVSPSTPKTNASGCGAFVAQPASRSASASVSAAILFIREALQAIERLQRLARRHLVGPQRFEGVAQRIFLRRFVRPRSRGKQIGLRRRGPQVLLQFGQVLARRAHHVLGDPGEVRHVDPV